MGAWMFFCIIVFGTAMVISEWHQTSTQKETQAEVKIIKQNQAILKSIESNGGKANAIQVLVLDLVADIKRLSTEIISNQKDLRTNRELLLEGLQKIEKRLEAIEKKVGK
jgi:hypothetical protein